MNRQKYIRPLLFFIIGTQFLFALKNPKTEFEVAVRHFNSDRFAIAEKILSKRNMEEWGEYYSAVLLLRIKCAYAQGNIEGSRSAIHEYLTIFPDSKYKSDVYRISGDILINEGYYSKALEFYLKARKISSEEFIIKTDNRILRTISIGIPVQDIEAIRLFEIEPRHIDILNIASAISHLMNGERGKAEFIINQVDPLNLPESYFDTYEDILKSVIRKKHSLNKIGVILPLTGELESRGNRFLDGLQTGFFTQTELDYSLLVYDNESSIIGTIQSMKELSRISPVSAIIGPLSPQLAMSGITSTFAEDKILILPYYTSESVTDITGNALQLESDLSLKGKLSAKYMTEILGLDSIAIVAPSTPKGRQCVDAFLEELDRKEINPVFVEWYSPETRNMKRQFSSLRKTAWKLIPEENEFEPFLGMDIDSLNAMFSIDTDDFFEDEVENENPLKTKRDSSKVPLATIDGLYLPLAHEDLSVIGTQLPMYNLQTQIVGHDGWLDLETLNKENIGPHFQNLILLTSTEFKSLSFSDTEKFNSGNTEYVDGYDTARFLSEYLSRESNETLELIETHSHLYYFPENGQINRAVNILSYKNFQFHSLGYFLSDSLISYVPQTP